MGGKHETPSNSDLEAPTPPASTYKNFRPANTQHADTDDSFTVATDVSSLTGDTMSQTSTLNSPSFSLPPAASSPLGLSRETINESTTVTFDASQLQANPPTSNDEEGSQMTGVDSKGTSDDSIALLKGRACRKHPHNTLAHPSTPGAVAVQQTKMMGPEVSLNHHVMDDIAEEADPEATDKEPEKSHAFIASAHLVLDDGGCYDPDSKIRVVAEVMDPDVSKVCGMTVTRTCRIAVVLIIVLLLGGIAVGVAFAVQGSPSPVGPSTQSPTPSPPETAPPTEANVREALFQELETWIIRSDNDRRLFQDLSSPQSHALEWLSTDDVAHAKGRSSAIVLERYVLAVLYFATDGPNWKRQDLKFLTGASVCDWNKEQLEIEQGFGVYCEDTSSVRYIFLPNIGLEGTIPWELSLLVDLKELYLDLNALTGSIPRELGDFRSLDFLSLSVNSLVGTIPAELGLLTALTALYVDINQLIGTLPTVLGLLTNLQVLYVDENQLTGTLPTEFGQLTALSMLHLENNTFTGTLPTELSQCNFTVNGEFVFSGNEFTGSVDNILCSNDPVWFILQSDCLNTTTNGDSEIQCRCCTNCCDVNGEYCQSMIPDL